MSFNSDADNTENCIVTWRRSWIIQHVFVDNYFIVYWDVDIKNGCCWDWNDFKLKVKLIRYSFLYIKPL